MLSHIGTLVFAPEPVTVPKLFVLLLNVFQSALVKAPFVDASAVVIDIVGVVPTVTSIGAAPPTEVTPEEDVPPIADKNCEADNKSTVSSAFILV